MMKLFWNGNILNIPDSKGWHLEFSDFENMGSFELRISFLDSDEDDIVVAVEDGSSFKTNSGSDSYPYFLFDYAEQVVARIQQCIHNEDTSIIDISNILVEVRNEWNTSQ